MNLPNKLTVLRVIMIPFFVFFYLTEKVYIADILFIVASLTDMLDGKIARKYNLVTNFGKFMDPLADKLLVAAALICFVEVIAAGYWGKIKTAVTMVTIIFMIPNFGGGLSGMSWITMLEQVLVYASLILTIISLIDYLVKNKEVLGGEM